jgi:type I restriction enzyme S subunit
LVLNDETVKYLRQTIGRDSPLFLRPGDVLVQRSNTAELVGTAAVFDGPVDTFVYPDLMMRLRFYRRPAAEWFWRYANSSNGRRFFRGAAAGSTGSMPKISGAVLRDMPIPWASDHEQEAVAEALGDADALIESLEQLLAKKRKLKQGAMQELLAGNMRLRLFEDGASLKASPIGPIPSTWAVERIEDFSHITTGDRNTQDRTEQGAFPFFVRSQEVEKINSYAFDGEAVLTAGDGVGTGKVFHYIKGKFNCHQRVYCINNFDRRMSGYFFFLYFSRHFYGRIAQMTAKSSVDSVRREMIADMLVPVPSSNEQSAIAAVLSDMDAELAAVEAKLAKVRLVKAGMMQELLTGSIRLV